MRRALPLLLGLTGLIGLIGAGCPQADSSGRFPYQTFVDTFGVAGESETGTQTGGGAMVAETVFRLPLTLRFENFHNQALLDTSFVAWVAQSSIRDQDQEDELFRNGYVQLTQEVRLGSAYALAPGTFVYNGPGTAGATSVVLEPATGGAPDFVFGEPTGSEQDQGGDTTQETRTPTTTEYQLLTPDVILVFSQPPVSCDSVAFTFRSRITGEVILGLATGSGGFKTYALVDAYECEPFQPGLFLRRIGTPGTQASNEYTEGQTIIFSFLPVPIAQSGAFCGVTIGQENSPYYGGGTTDGGGG